jgi:hypothetical protein
LTFVKIPVILVLMGEITNKRSSDPVIQTGIDKGRIGDIDLAHDMAKIENKAHNEINTLERRAIENYKTMVRKNNAIRIALNTLPDQLPSKEILTEHVRNIEASSEIQNSLLLIAKEKARQQLKYKNPQQEPREEELDELSSAYYNLLTTLLKVSSRTEEQQLTPSSEETPWRELTDQQKTERLAKDVQKQYEIPHNAAIRYAENTLPTLDSTGTGEYILGELPDKIVVDEVDYPRIKK